MKYLISLFLFLTILTPLTSGNAQIDSKTSFSVDLNWQYRLFNHKDQKWQPVKKLDNKNLSSLETCEFRKNLILNKNTTYAVLNISFYFNSQIFFNDALFHSSNILSDTSIIPIYTGKKDFFLIPKILNNEQANSLTIRTKCTLRNIKNLSLIKLNEHYIIKKKWVYNLSWDIAISIISIFLAMFFGFSFIKQSSEKYYLYFAILSFFLAIWSFAYSGLFFWFSDKMQLYAILRHSGSIVCVVTTILFVKSFLNIQSKWIAKTIIVLYSIIFLFLLTEIAFTSNYIFYQKYVFKIFMIFTFPVIGYGIYLAVKGIKLQREYAKMIFTGSIILGFFVILTIIKDLLKIEVHSQISEAFFILTIIFAATIASRYTSFYGKLQTAHDDLQKLDKQKDFILNKLNMYEHIVSTSHDHMAFFDTDYNILAVNNAILDASNLQRAYVQNIKLNNLYSDTAFSSQLLEYCKKTAANKTASYFERAIQFNQNSKKYMLIHIYPYMNSISNGLEGFVLHATDITDRINFEDKIVTLAHDERRKIGMELHDDISQILAGLKLKVNAIFDQVDDTLLKSQVLDIETQIVNALNATRKIAKGLFPIDLNIAGPESFFNEVKNLSEKYRIRLQLEIDESIQIHNIMQATHIFYIIQEAITNIIKHAEAEKILISFQRQNNNIILTISDNGIGFSTDNIGNPGIGLNIIKYRCRMIDAVLDILSNKHGTTITCLIPEL